MNEQQARQDRQEQETSAVALVSSRTAREQHLDWAKGRALAYLPGDVTQATASFISDLGKHEDTAGHGVIELIATHMMAGLLDARTCRDLIEETP